MKYIKIPIISSGRQSTNYYGFSARINVVYTDDTYTDDTIYADDVFKYVATELIEHVPAEGFDDSRSMSSAYALLPREW